jgi:hypothetical protein
MGDYVEQIANSPENFPNAATIIASAGMDARANHTRKASVFKVRSTGTAGEMQLRTTYVPASIYHWQKSTDGVSWLPLGVSRKASYLVSGLTSGTKYFFRVAIDDRDGMGPWSDDISKVVE